LDIIDHAVINAVLDWLEIDGIKLVGSMLADPCHEAVLCRDLEVFIAGFGCPLVVFGV